MRTAVNIVTRLNVEILNSLEVDVILFFPQHGQGEQEKDPPGSKEVPQPGQQYRRRRGQEDDRGQAEGCQEGGREKGLAKRPASVPALLSL